MNTIGKIFFWIFAIGLGFVNPLITFGLIILYYLPRIIQDLRHSCNEQVSSEMNSFSEDILEEMK
ncbi:MAG: hypothetical protein EX284_05125 [Candidatus Nitrosopumilus sp. MTA1]|nr:hypothetical protein [Candidatus Nitrosopumilus sp. MTA1]